MKDAVVSEMGTVVSELDKAYTRHENQRCINERQQNIRDNMHTLVYIQQAFEGAKVDPELTALIVEQLKAAIPKLEY